MSYSTTAVLIALSPEDEAIGQVGNWLRGNAQGQQLDRADLHGGGGFNCMGHSVWTADFDYLDRCGFEEAVMAAPWRVPSEVVLYISDECGDTFARSPAKPDPLVLSEAERWYAG